MFDPHAVLQRLGGDRQLLRTLIVVFLDEAPKLLAEARDAIARLDGDKAGFAAHNLRGLAANTGAPQVSADAKRLEEWFDDRAKIDSQIAAEARQILAELTIAVERFSRQLQQHLAANP